MKNGAINFNHVYFNAPWSGELISKLYAREGAPAACSESWEISGHPSGMSIVCGGEYDGRTLDSLVAEFGRDLLGTKSPTADKFPLLFKLIDARWPLSLQVHPNNENAALTNGQPKTEAWFVVKAFPGAVLYAGLKRKFTPDKLRAIVEQGPLLLDQLNALKVSEGDMLYIPGGMPHAIGGGCLIYEVQQSSDTTYRFYDWDRKGPDGKGRALHIEECFKSIDFDIPPSQLCRDDLKSPFFHIRTHNLDDAVEFTPDGSSFIAGFVLSGATDVAGNGESFLIPASSTAVKVTPTAPGTKLIITEL